MNKRNFLLVGNSRLHWALEKGNNYDFIHSLKNEVPPKNIKFEDLIWASVGNLPDFDLNQCKAIYTKDIKLENLPNHLGVDRALACFAAFKNIENKKNKNFLIADLGTSMSLTKISSEGKFIGGQLTAGFYSQIKTLSQDTKNLIVPKHFKIPKNNFLISTEEAILKGVFNSLIGSINLAFNQKDDILVICGGDSELIGEYFKGEKNNVIIEPNLVMHGMIKFYNFKKVLF